MITLILSISPSSVPPRPPLPHLLALLLGVGFIVRQGLSMWWRRWTSAILKLHSWNL